MPKVEIVSSPANPLLKSVRKAVMGGGLTAEGLCVAETFHLLDEALRSRCVVNIVIAAESLFRVPFVYGIDPGQTREMLARQGLALYASLPRRSANHAKALGDADLTHPFAMIIGSEGHGVSEASLSGAISLNIPTKGVE